MFDFSLQWLIVALDVSAKAVLLAIVAAAVLRLPRLRDSNFRHRAWAGVLVGMLLLPILSQVVPALRLPIAVPESWTISVGEQVTDTVVSTEQTALPAPQEIEPVADTVDVADQAATEIPMDQQPWREADLMPVGPYVSDFDRQFAEASSTAETEAAQSADVGPSSVEPAIVPAITSQVLAHRSSQPWWPTALFGIWLTGAGLLALRLLIGVGCSIRLVYCSLPISSEELSAQGINTSWVSTNARQIRISECPLLRVPIALGVFRPRILLPPEWTSWSTTKLQAVLAHERMHIERADCAVLMLANLNRCVYWFHPLAWWLRTQLGTLAEIACDDAAIDSTGDRTTYARHLLELASEVSGRSRLVSTGISMARTSNVESRINAILDFTRPLSQRFTWMTSLALMVFLVPLITLAAALRPATQANDPRQPDEIAVADAEVGDAASDDQSADAAGSDQFAVALIETNASTSGGESGSSRDSAEAQQKLLYSGSVTNSDGKPIAGAKISLAITSHEEFVPGSLSVMTTSDDQGKFHFALDGDLAAAVKSQLGTLSPQVVAQADRHGLDWLPLEVFGDQMINPERQERIQTRVDKALGIGRFASRTLKLRSADRPIRGRFVDLEGRPVRGATVQVENLQHPDVDLLQKAFAEKSKRYVYDALNATSTGYGWLERQVLQRLIPAVTTDANGEFELDGIGRDQMVTLAVVGENVEGQLIQVLGRSMEPAQVPHLDFYPEGYQETYAGWDFSISVGPSVAVEGVVRDYDSGEPIADTLVFVERLFQEGSQSGEEKVRLNTYHLQATTDEQGRFRITGMPPGSGHVLNAVPPKSEPYLMAAHEVALAQEEFPAKQIVVQVKKTFWIEGRVTDKQTGKPLKANVDYLALRQNPNTLDKLGLKQAWRIFRYRTDSDGRYRVPGLPGPGVAMARSMDGKGYPRAVGAELIDGYRKGSMSLPTTPTGMPLSNWHLLKQIDPPVDAESFKCDFVLDAGQTIPGRVVGPNGDPISDLKVVGQVVNDVFWNSQQNETFQVEGYDGKGPRQLFFKNEDELLVGQYLLTGDAPEEIVVSLEPAVRVTGRLIETETGVPAEGYGIHCEKSSLGEFRIDDCYTDDKGRFVLKGLHAGLVYKMDAYNARRFSNNKNKFQIDLTNAKPGDVIELGDVTGPNAKRAMNRTVSLTKEKPAGIAAVAESAGQSSGAQQIKTETPATADATSFRFAGQVIAPNGTPVAGAKVSVIRTRNPQPFRERHKSTLLAETETDATGQFEVSLSRDQVPTGVIDEKSPALEWIDLVATKSGYGFAYGRSLGTDPANSQQRLTWTEHSDRPDSNVLTLVTDDMPIRGQLFDVEGKPVANAIVTPTDVWSGKDGTLDAWQASADTPDEKFSLAQRRFTIARSQLHLAFHDRYQGVAPTIVAPVKTDAAGRFTLHGFGRERFVELIIKAPGIETTPLYVRTEAGDTVTLRGSRGRAEMDEPVYPAEFTRVLGPSIPFIGLVTNQETGEPIVDCVLTPHVLPNYYVNEDVRMENLSATTNDQGRFRLEGLPLGRTGLTINPPRGSAFLATRTQVNVQISRPSVVRRVKLAQGVKITGQVKDSRTGEPIAGTVDFFTFTTNPLLEQIGDYERGSDEARYRTDENGRFEIAGLPGQGILAFRADRWSDYPLAVGADKIDGPKQQETPMVVFSTEPRFCVPKSHHMLLSIDLDSDAEQETVDFVLDSGAILTGTVVDNEGEPVRDFYVHNAAGGWAKAEGESFTVRGYFPSDGRRLLFFEPGRNLVGMLSVQGEQTTPLEVRLQPGGTISGRIVDASGRPLENLEFENSPGTSADPAYGRLLTYLNQELLTTDADGRFMFSGLIPGLKYSADVSGEQMLPEFAAPVMWGLGTAFSDITIEPGESKDLGVLTVKRD